MRVLCRLLEEFLVSPTLTVSALSIVVILRCLLKFSSELFSLLFVGRDVSAVKWFLECYYSD